MPKPLDIVRTPDGGIAVVTAVSERGVSSVHFLDGNSKYEKSAWYEPGEITVVDSLPHILCDIFEGNNYPHKADKYFPVKGRRR